MVTLTGNRGVDSFIEEGGVVLVTPIHGMTLRDWFAGMALQGMLAASQGVSFKDPFTSGPRDAYKFADAMLEARKK